MTLKQILEFTDEQQMVLLRGMDSNVQSEAFMLAGILREEILGYEVKSIEAVNDFLNVWIEVRE